MNTFKKYDHVRIKNLSGGCMSHFPHSTDAIVMYTYADRYGGNDRDNMCLFVNGHGETSWYKPCNIELIDNDRKDLLDKWKKDEEETVKRESDLDWIFKHGKEIAKGNGYTGTVAETLYRCITSISIWGPSGEGYVFYMNALRVHEVAKPFLEKGDKAGWLRFIEEMKQKRLAKEME
jgi:hypothetical protein